MEGILYNNLQIFTFVNKPVSSNTYLIVDRNTNNCIVIDPGSKEDNSIRDYINLNKYNLEYIILTHEHFDHYWGVNYLRMHFNPLIIANDLCAEWIKTPRNYFNKYYYNSEDMYMVDRVDITIGANDLLLSWGEYLINIFNTKGHSNKSICVLVNELLFTGDTMIYNTLPVLKKRYGASIDQLFKSISFIYKSCDVNTLVFPGHGKPFFLHEMIQFYQNYFKENGYCLTVPDKML